MSLIYLVEYNCLSFIYIQSNYLISSVLRFRHFELEWLQDLVSWFRGFLVAAPVSWRHKGNGAFFKPSLTYRYTQLFQLYVIRVKVYCMQNMGNQRKYHNSSSLWYNQCWKKTQFFTQKREFRTCIKIFE